MLNLIGRAEAITFPTLPLLETGDWKAILSSILTFILALAGAIAVIYLIYGGILYITAGGDAEKATKGRTAIVNAIIGIVIIALAIVIVNVVSNLLKNAAGGF